MNVAAIIEAHPSDQVALISRGRSITYGQLREQVAGFAGALVELGVQAGERVVIACDNSPMFVVAYLGAMRMGAVAVPLNPASPGPELAQQAAQVGTSVAVVGPAAAESWSRIDASAIGELRAVVASSDGSVAGAMSFEDAVAHAPAAIVEREPGDLAALLFTSGTAGAPRAAMLTHDNLLANIAQSRTRADAIRTDDLVYCVLPLHHIFGMNAVLGGALHAGATVLLVQRFDPTTAIESIAERKVTVVPGAPPMWVAWANFAEAPATSFSSVRLALSGAAKLPEDASRSFTARFGVPILEGYGLTEAAPVVTSSVGLEPRIGSIGVPLAGVEVRVVDPDGADVLAGDAGEIWVRGRNVFAGYWGDPTATAAVLDSNGWLHTGDIAVVDDEGYVFLVDRAKDLIIVSGFNVYPAEVEEVISELDSVAEVAVVGVPHPHTGEAVKAYVVRAPGADPDEEEIIAYCAENLARYKCPSKVLFVDELPKGLSGKVLRRVLA